MCTGGGRGTVLKEGRGEKGAVIASSISGDA